MKQLIKPPRLRQGDVVGLIAPGGYTTDRAIEKAVRNIEALGFRVRTGAYLRAVYGNYGGSVQQRLADLHAMFADPEVKAIWPIRGGSGCISLLAHLDYELIRRNPKVLLGYSDITALHLAMYKKVGLVTFHGPVASSTMSDYSREHMMAVLTEPQSSYTIPMSPDNAKRALSEPHYGIRTVTSGVATGPLMGGNLSLVSALAGTPYAADIHGSILFLEEVNEAPYRIDRWMTQLDLASGFSKAAAVMVGICDNCGPEHEEISLTLDQTLDLHLKPLTIPTVTGYSIGHIRNQFTLPMGIRATLDTESQTVTLLEAAVS
ncbi:S66 peptidase family protein [Massilia niastensis]|uniref:S66 peptidase family protein n=1 Tax=Massilia niastensis TaxID=544911 RepID=UPI001E336529|nr:LD-carboxypeptidase [Massilia niastensis]